MNYTPIQYTAPTEPNEDGLYVHTCSVTRTEDSKKLFVEMISKNKQLDDEEYKTIKQCLESIIKHHEDGTWEAHATDAKKRIHETTR